MVPGKQYTAEDWLRAMWRRKWLILLSFVLVTTATVVVASRLPDRYRAEALIVTKPESVSQDYVRTTVTSRTQVRDRLPTISQQIRSRARLEPIIHEFDLYAQMRQTQPMEVVIERMRDEIEIKVSDGYESFRISFEAAETPDLAVKITERLAAVAIEENIRDREVLARATSSFLEGQLEDARKRLVEQEKRLEAYRLKHGSELPTQLQSNMQAIQTTQMQIQSLIDSLNRDRDRRLLASRQLADLQSQQLQTAPGPAGSASTASTASTPLPPAPDLSLSTQLENALTELRALERRVTPEHPDLIRAKRLVENLEAQVQTDASPKPAGEVRPKPLTATELARRNRVRELQLEIESLDRQIATKTAEEAELRRTSLTYRSRVEAVPTRESELAALTRDYDTLQGLYRTLLTKKEDSKVAEELELRQVGDQFRIVDPPRRPEKPVAPNRRLIDLLGAAGSLVLGFGLALLLEVLDTSLKADSDVRLALGLPVLGLIPKMVTVTEQRRARLLQAAFSVGLVVIFAGCATAVWLTFRI
jgi:polysaccharide chain length determinant protein (PEP-CTERM system associated)